MLAFSFVKYEGLGNDFIVVRTDEWSEKLVSRAINGFIEHASRLCDRRRGIGADGILLIGKPINTKSIGSMIVINADGSRPEMCGNGLRCAVHELLGDRPALRAGAYIDTDRGPLFCQARLELGETAEIQIDMGPAEFLGEIQPSAAPTRTFVNMSMGNPHAVHLVHHEDPEALARTLGPKIETDAAYPNRTNVEFARLEADQSLLLWVWERGCGITDACGTGACATAAVAVRQGWREAGHPLRVILPGGSLTVTVPADPQLGIEMVGPSTRVFFGRAVLQV
jgi:diaminopimelate epimerase